MTKIAGMNFPNTEKGANEADEYYVNTDKPMELDNGQVIPPNSEVQMNNMLMEEQNKRIQQQMQHQIRNEQIKELTSSLVDSFRANRINQSNKLRNDEGYREIKTIARLNKLKERK